MLRGRMRSRARPARGLSSSNAILVAVVLTSTSAALRVEAAEPAAPAAPTDPDGWSDRLVLETGRFAVPAPDPHLGQIGLHGEYQLRLVRQTELPLTPPAREPTREASVLGQEIALHHWLRLKPRFDLGDTASIVGELDVRGLAAGDTTRFVTAARDPGAERDPFEIHPRQLYVEVRTPIGLFRAGQQAASWGMGLVANGGDTPSLFGDYRRGDLVERFLFATKPGGKDHPFVVALAGDLVFEDDTADLRADELATQAVLAMAWRDTSGELGIYGVIRHHERTEPAVAPTHSFEEDLNAYVLDVAGKFHGRIPGARAFGYGEFEGALILGDTSFVRGAWQSPIDPSRAGEVREDLVQLGGAARLGIVHLSHEPAGDVLDNGMIDRGPVGDAPFGDLVGEIEIGWASGDADPSDGTSRRFVMDANHNVGLVLFDQVLAWKTARSATIAQDPRVVGRSPPGVDLLASNGGVFGATYLNPRFIGRPARFLDLKAGVVIAQATSDVVDPYQFGALGSARSWDGGPPSRRDLGIELDAGFEVRIPVGRDVVTQVGFEGGVFFPGGAFDDAGSHHLPTQALGQGELGLQF